MTNLAKHTEPAPLERADNLQPRDVPEAMQMAEALVKSGLMPAGVNTAQAAFAIIVTGRELGLSAMQALRSIHVIKGKATLSADLILALVKRNPACQVFQLVESTDKRAVYRTTRVGEEPTTMEFTMAEAAAAGLLGNDSWRKFPKAMLRARCIAALARAVYPDVVLGIYEPDELAEHAPAPKQVAANVVHDAIPEASGSHPAVTTDALTPELRASVLLERMNAATTRGELLEVWDDVREAKDAISAEHMRVLGQRKDEMKAKLTEAA